MLKTFNPPPEALVGAPVDSVSRHGKFLDLDCGGTHLVFHLARAGWLRWSESLSQTRLRPGKSPIALRVRMSDGSGFDLTEAGTKKSLAAYIVSSPEEVPGIAALGPDPLADSFSLTAFREILGSRNAQVKGVLRDQHIIAGVGNAYSDEILHVAKALALRHRRQGSTTSRPNACMPRCARRCPLRSSPRRASPRPSLKDAKRQGMRVHGRTGQVCPECGDTVREVSFADSSLQYCATCQTGGKPLADRRTSKFLK